MANDVSFGIGQGVTPDIAEATGAWWETTRDIIQPTEFLFKKGGAIIQSSYSDGPLARTLAEDVCWLVDFLKSR